ncbi:hypothetical protein [Chryseobacterium lathyri]|uniref:hypothetical protein n=1 Tax=Chryseobacterium lathyri TaxID=395933 RepID=UPI0027817E9F|nr:hypothetical protein [Chryseobacterium lathyri]MDQ0065162.1 hypothetical protein [Chryseobacterium lathyri]
MDILFNYLEKKYLEKKYEPLKLEFCKTSDQLTIKNSFYYFRLNKLNDRYVLSRFWKRGFLFLLFKKQNMDMTNIYEDIKEFAQKENIIIEELFYNSSAIR